MNSNMYGEKINKIKEERRNLLQLVKLTLNDNKNSVNTNIDKLTEVINFDEINIKKYENLTKIQDIITNLVDKISKTDDILEIMELRKTVNYYINKVKNEIKKRNLDETKLNTYQQKITYMRRDIAKYIRYLKRENNILQIEDLISRMNELNDEELGKLNKMIKLEDKYNKRALIVNENDSEQEKIFKITTDVANKLMDVSEKHVTTPEGNTMFNYNFVLDQKESDSSIDNCVDKLVFDSAEEFLETRVGEYERRYRITNPDVYIDTDSTFKNLMKFLHNIPIYRNNNKRLRIMEHDARNFYRGSDLIGFIEYTRRRNAIKYGLRRVFSKSKIYSKDEEYLNNHNMCVEWLLNFCRRHDLDLNYIKRVKAI